MTDHGVVRNKNVTSPTPNLPLFGGWPHMDSRVTMHPDLFVDSGAV